MNNEIVDKIKKLLALATSPEEHEAKLATEKANELLIKYNLKMQDIQVTEEKEYIERTLFAGAKEPIEQKWVQSILRKHFFVEVVSYRHRNIGITRDYMFGEETNIEVASFVYTFLMKKFYELWREYKWKHNAEASQKQSYYSGLYKGISEQLSSRLQKVQTETGLVVIRDPKLDEHTANMKNKNYQVNNQDAHAYSQGYEVGKKLKIQKGIESDSSNSGKYLK